MMRLCLRSGALVVGLLCSVNLWAQTPSLSCRPLQPDNTYIDPDEKVIGNQVCKAADSTPTQKQGSPQRLVTATTVVSAPPAPSPIAAPQPASENMPIESGMYLSTTSGYTKILGQIIDFRRSGSLLASDATLHLKSAKENVQLLGPHAQTITSSTPEFYFIPTKQEADAGVNAGDFILVHLEEKKERRQVEIGAQGVGRASKGIALTHQIQVFRSEVKPGVYKIAPAMTLSRGEYGLYLSRGEGMAPYIYDFSVQ